MNDYATREIQHAPTRHDAAAPNHVDKWKVNQGEPAGEKQHVRFEGHPIRKCSRDQRRRDDRKHHLIGAEHDHRNRWIDQGRRVQRNPAQKRPVEVSHDAEEVCTAL